LLSFYRLFIRLASVAPFGDVYLRRGLGFEKAAKQ